MLLILQTKNVDMEDGGIIVKNVAGKDYVNMEIKSTNVPCKISK